MSWVAQSNILRVSETQLIALKDLVFADWKKWVQLHKSSLSHISCTFRIKIKRCTCLLGFIWYLSSEEHKVLQGYDGLFLQCPQEIWRGNEGETEEQREFNEVTGCSHWSDTEWLNPGSPDSLCPQLSWPSTSLVLFSLSLPSKECLWMSVSSLFVLALLIVWERCFYSPDLASLFIPEEVSTAEGVQPSDHTAQVLQWVLLTPLVKQNSTSLLISP